MYDARHAVYSDRLRYEIDPANEATLVHLRELRDVAAASGFDRFTLALTDEPAEKPGRLQAFARFGDLHSKLICVALAGVYGFYDVVQMLSGA